MESPKGKSCVKLKIFLSHYSSSTTIRMVAGVRRNEGFLAKASQRFETFFNA